MIGDFRICKNCGYAGPTVEAKIFRPGRPGKVIEGCGGCLNELAIIKTCRPLTPEDKCPFGKYKGVVLIDVPKDYLLWCYDNIEWLRSDVKHYIETMYL